MPRKPVIDMSAWPSLTLEGNLIAPAMVARIDQRAASEQTEESYGIRKGLTLRDEISMAFRVGQSHFDTFAKAQAPGADATRRYVRDFLKETFGYDDLTPETGAVAFLAGGRVPIVVVPPTEALDKRSPTLSTERNRSPAFALQDWLNERDDALWGLVTNGTRLRLMRDNASLTRPAFIEADLAQIFINEDAASFAALWLLIHRTRFGRTSAPAADCALERWREAGSKEGEAARDRLAGQVEEALRILGTGFLEANPELARRLQSGALPLTDWFNELLRLVYRLIFLMVAEDRNLLHPEKADKDAHRLYADGYSLSVLRAQSIRRAAWDRHHDRFEGLKIVFRALAHGEPALGLPALGGMFGRDQLPTLEAASLHNRALMEALYRLSWLTDGTGLVPVNWRAMETEELGSVYESLLELQPQLAEDGRALAFATDTSEQRGNQRKTTGSYYTPDSLVQALLDTALDPVLDRAEAESDDKASALLALTVIDPACGSGHFLLAAARRIATRVARIRADGTPSLTDFRHALRDVARCCLHGVDKNPMAVELTKVALWIETVDPGLPLGFFDAQIRCGDALLGVFDLKALEQGIPDAAYKPLSGDDKETAKHFAKRNKAEKAGQGMLDFHGGGGSLPVARQLADLGTDLRALPETTVAEIEAKATRFRDLRRQPELYNLKIACDAYVAAFLAPKLGGVPANYQTVTIPTTSHVWQAVAGGRPYGPLVARVDQLANDARAFHWPIEFPNIMAKGGFDVVLGNPPWERIKLQEQEFFAARSPAIANAPNKAARDKLIMALEKAEPGTPDQALYDAFVNAKREAEAASEFARTPGNDGGRFPLTGRGDVNTYALFAELFSQLSGTAGRAGVIVPTGIATDATTAPFFAAMVEGKRLSTLFDFENRAGLFPAVDSRMKFCLLTLGQNEGHARFAFFVTDAAQLSEAERCYTLSATQIGLLNPNSGSAPVFRGAADAELTAKMYGTSVILVNERDASQGNKWNIQFHTRIWHMSEDSAFFMNADELLQSGYIRDGRLWRKEDFERVPLYEAKLMYTYDHRAASYSRDSDDRGYRVLPPATDSEHADPHFEPEPFYWVPKNEVERRLKKMGWTRSWLFGWRDITSPTNERSMLPTVFPLSGSADTFLLMLPLIDSVPRIAGLIANLSSIPLDYTVRQKLGGIHLKLNVTKQLPVLPPTFYTEPRLSFVVPRVLELTYTSHSLTPFARDLGYDGPPFRWDEERRALLRADLDAFYARAYGLDRGELRYILDPADVKGPDYPSETFRVLKEKEIRQYGEYRTRRLVLEAWDRMAADGTFAALGMADATSAAKQQTIQLSALVNLQDAAWAREAPSPQHDPSAALAAILKSLDGPTPIRTVRLTAAIMLEPHLLTPLLSPEDQAQWRRLVGQEAEPRSGNVIGFAARTTPGWNAAITNHRGNGRLLEDIAARTWSPGTGLERFDTAGWPEGRARFVINALRKLDIDATIEAAPGEIRGWIGNVANG
jgi:hypothetical protein